VAQNVFSHMQIAIRVFIYYIYTYYSFIYLFIYVSKTLNHIDPAQNLLDIFCCVECTSLVFLDAACYPDVAFHSPTEGRDGSSSCCATALSVTTCELEYDVNFVTSE